MAPPSARHTPGEELNESGVIVRGLLATPTGRQKQDGGAAWNALACFMDQVALLLLLRESKCPQRSIGGWKPNRSELRGKSGRPGRE